MNDFVLSDLHLMGLSKVPTHADIDLVPLLARCSSSLFLQIRWSSPCMSAFNSKLNTIIQIEKQIALRSNRSTAYENKWFKFFLRKISLFRT